jgi:alpha-D-ribose 1-methylphosphonate 5-triphosphate diphosphatase
MLESDRQLATNGITTAYHGITISWEPGLRSISQSMNVIAALDAIAPQALVENRLHIRWENFAVDQLPDVLSLLERQQKPVLAFNDHTSSGIAGTRNPSKYKSSAEKAMISVEDYMDRLAEIAKRTDEVKFATEVAAAHATKMGVTLLSHDDVSPEMRSQYRALGVKIAEFPLNWETADAAAAAGDEIVLGAPNVVRGGSHNGAISAADAIKRGCCHVLASDYYYPSLRHAALKLAHEGVIGFEAAWDLVSAAPARVVGLSDRGTLAKGKRADIIIIDPRCQQVVQTICGGRTVFKTH